MNAKQRKLKKLAIILLAVIAILAISIPVFAATNGDEIGRASCRERV